MINSNTESKLLKYLKNAKEDYLSGAELSVRLKISRSAIWKHVEALRNVGYEIAASPHRGYRILSVPDRLLPDEITNDLNTRRIGHKILSYESLDSTNRMALEMGAQGTPEGVVIFAEEQTKGKGRLGRRWVSPKGKGLTFSVILRPILEILELPRITLMAAVATAQALTELIGQKVHIRWPNDLLLNERKICGILTEMNAESDRIGYVVMGIGVNVNTERTHLPEGATSLKEETGQTWNRCSIAARILEKLEHHYENLNRGRFQEMALIWENHSSLTGRRIVVRTLRETIEGTASGIDEDGALWIRQDSGVQTKILSADIIKLR